MSDEIILRPKRLLTHEVDFGTTVCPSLWLKAINNLKFVEKSFPIGYVLFFYASQTNISGNAIDKPNPEIWKELDGRVVNDIDSPLNGITLPDLRNRFLKGSNTYGSFGGQETINLSHNHGGLTNYFNNRTSGADSGNNHTGGSNHAHPIGSNLSSNENVVPPFVSFAAYVRYK